VEGLDHIEDDAWGTVFRDVILLALIGFVAMVIMMLPHIKPVQEQREEAKAPGNVIVEMHWPNELPFDVDLWVKAPDELPVGFWNQGGKTFNLLRDDLGGEFDATEQNYEISYSRGIPTGEYIVNVHMYGPLAFGTTIPVNVVVSVKSKFAEAHQILNTTVLLKHRGQEETAYRFRLDQNGELVKGSVSTLKYSMISGGQK
jgi:hypothetical protein